MEPTRRMLSSFFWLELKTEEYKYQKSEACTEDIYVLGTHFCNKQESRDNCDAVTAE